MTGEIEAAGDAITGGMLARAVEPGHGEAHEAGHGACLNCGTAVTGNYCPECGQAAHLHRSFAAIGHDLAHGVLHFEGKIFTTLPELALRPGQLTRRYIHGERAKFVSPFALFLFSAFLMYAIFSLTSHHGPEGARNQVKMNSEAIAELKKEEEKADARIAKVQAQLAEPGISASRRETLQEKLKDAQDERKGLSLASGLTDALAGEGVNKNVADTVGKAISASRGIKYGLPMASLRPESMMMTPPLPAMLPHAAIVSKSIGMSQKFRSRVLPSGFLSSMAKTS